MGGTSSFKNSCSYGPIPLKFLRYEGQLGLVGGGGLTIAEIAKCREYVLNEKHISQQWKDPLSKIPIL